MGATAAILAIRPAELVMANVGDCRIYRVAGGRLGRMSIDDRTQDPGSSAVTQALGGSARIDAHVWEQDLKGGTERYVLCTDGVWGALEPAKDFLYGYLLQTLYAFSDGHSSPLNA